MILPPYNLFKYKGINLISFLVTLTLFSGIFLTISQWMTYQRQSAVQIYQYSQALQLAENQQQRLLAKLPCQSVVEQNQIRFTIRCESNRVTVRYPAGEMSLTIN